MNIQGVTDCPGFADPVRSGCTTTVNRSKAFPDKDTRQRTSNMKNKKIIVYNLDLC